MSEAGVADRAGAGGLARGLGAVDGAGIVVSNVVGIGIFTTPGLVAALVPGRAAFFGVWIAGGVLALIGGLVYAELAGAYPEAGGEYVFIREAFGPAAAFLSGWTSLLAGFSGAIAAGAVGSAIHLERLFPALAEPTPWRPSLGPLTLELGPRTFVALALIGTLTLVHARGLRPGRALQNALAGLSVATIAGLVASGLLSGPTLVESDAAWGDAAPSPVGGALMALILVMFTYSGWNAATYLAGEIRSPERTIRRALVAGTLLVAGLYLGLNALYVRTVPFTDLAGSVAVADLAAEATLGRFGGAASALVVGLALASGVSAMLLTGPRVYLAMARDGTLPAAFARVDPDARVPSFGVAAQGAWAAVLVLVGGFEALLTYTAFAVVLFSAAAVASLLVLRRRPSFLARSRVPTPGYPWAPVLFLVASAAMLIQAIRFAPATSLAGAALIAAGLPVHAWRRRRRPPARQTRPVDSPILKRRQR